MSVTVNKLKREDFSYMVSEGGRSLAGNLTEEEAARLERADHSYTIIVDGDIAAVAGVAEYWPGRAEAWAVLHPSCKKHFFTVHNVVKRFLGICPVTRIEAAVEVGFEQGHRWVRALGFNLENVRARAFLPGGRDASLYAMVKGEGDHG